MGWEECSQSTHVLQDNKWAEVLKMGPLMNKMAPKRFRRSIFILIHAFYLTRHVNSFYQLSRLQLLALFLLF